MFCYFFRSELLDNRHDIHSCDKRVFAANRSLRRDCASERSTLVLGVGVMLGGRVRIPLPAEGMDLSNSSDAGAGSGLPRVLSRKSSGVSNLK